MRSVPFFVGVILAVFVQVVVPGSAVAQRDVMLNVCNETGFSVAVAAAYRTSPTEDRTLRSWFLVGAGTCLEGAVNNVVGDTLDLHVMSGEWRWPARGGDSVWCVPSETSFSLASSEPCRAGREARDFVRLPITSSRYRGLGQIDYRVRCASLNAPDATLCVGAPRDERGLAQPVRTLEVCHSGRGEADAVVFVARTDGGFDVVGRQTIASGECADIYRGFLPGNVIFVGAVGRANSDGIGQVCLSEDGRGPVRPTAQSCGEAGWVQPEMHSFRANVSRFTAYLE